MSFDDFVARATGGSGPYPYQSRLAEYGLPEVLHVPTGSGKTLAATLPWLYRRERGMESTRWLVLVLPQRTLVEQTRDVVKSWITNLNLAVPVHTLMGGEDPEDQEWKSRPDLPRIFVGTQDMVLSRLLMRGFAESRASWPMSFGLLHAGVQFVFDEIQLMGPGLATTLQLQAFREDLGCALPCHSMWMSATIDLERLRTVDFARKLVVAGLERDDRSGELGKRLQATREIRHLDLPVEHDAKALAERIMAEHRTGTRTLVVLNTVDRATALYQALNRRKPDSPLILLHSRFRTADRARHTAAAKDHANAIIVATQVLEAGVDLTSDMLITEVAPWSSIVQRAGRCNRDGKATGPRLLWFQPPRGKTAHLPYQLEEMESTAAKLRELEGQALTGEQLAEQGVDDAKLLYPLLRRRDLIGLFDTAPDLSGNDIDVSTFIRDADERTGFLAWREISDSTDTMGLPRRAELCPAPLDQMRSFLGSHRVLVYDQSDGRWRAARREDIRPTALLIAEAADGGYDAEIGFAPKSKAPVIPVEQTDTKRTRRQSSGSKRWIELDEHLADTERDAGELLTALRPTGLTERHEHAIVLAARYHDLGKAHPIFQAALDGASTENPRPKSDATYAKSGGAGRLRHERPGFRHELVSALLLHESDVLDGIVERDLVTYLALAHHGMVRLTVRGLPNEPGDIVLGVRDGDMTIGTDSLPPVSLSLAPIKLGAGSLADRALRLRDRADLGPFRLAFCEALVRSADWLSSSRYEEMSS